MWGSLAALARQLKNILFSWNITYLYVSEYPVNPELNQWSNHAKIGKRSPLKSDPLPIASIVNCLVTVCISFIFGSTKDYFSLATSLGEFPGQ